MPSLPGRAAGCKHKIATTGAVIDDCKHSGEGFGLDQHRCRSAWSEAGADAFTRWYSPSGAAGVHGCKDDAQLHPAL